LTDYCSRYFWQTIPADFHTFNTIVAINNDHDDAAASEIDSQNSDEVLDEDEEIGPITNDEFQRTSHWYFFNNNEFERNQCAICRSDFEQGERITALNCLHQYHTNCVQRWVTEVSGTCPHCREDTSRSRLRNVSTSLFIAGATADTNDLEISSISNSLSSSSINSDN
jgi:hypothetical protein